MRRCECSCLPFVYHSVSVLSYSCGVSCPAAGAIRKSRGRLGAITLCTFLGWWCFHFLGSGWVLCSRSPVLGLLWISSWFPVGVGVCRCRKNRRIEIYNNIYIIFARAFLFFDLVVVRGREKVTGGVSLQESHKKYYKRPKYLWNLPCSASYGIITVLCVVLCLQYDLLSECRHS